MAGLVACVWQAFPQLSNMEIIRMIKQYSSRYTSPDNSLGYGIPDVYALYQDYSTKLGLLEEESGPGHILFFGNVLVVNCIFGSGSSPYAVLYTQSGQKVSQWKLQQPQDITHWESLPSGFYLLSVSNGQSKRVAKLVKR
jgi:hypothetical protein